MKINKLSLLLLTSICFSSLISCNKDKEEEPPYNPDTTILNNLEVDKEDEEKIEHKYVTYLDTINQNEYEIYNDRYVNSGLIVLKNKYGRVGFYSIPHQKFILKCSYYYEWLDYKVIATGHAFFIKVDYENKTLVVDNFGNKLSFTDKLTSFNIETKLVNDKIYVIYENDIETSFYYYDNSSLIETSFIPNEEIIPEELEIVYDYQDLIVDTTKLDLTDYGLTSYSMIRNTKGLMTVFNELDESICTFYIKDYDKSVLVGENIYYQNVYDLAVENEKYDYYDNELNHSLETKRVNILTGVEETLNFNYLVNSAEAIKNDDKLLKEAIVNLTFINDDKVLTETRDYLVNENLELVHDFTGVSPKKFISVNSGYYNTETKMLYDSDLKVVSNIERINPKFYKNHQVFLGSYEGKYGIIDTQSIVKLPFIYDEIIFDDDCDYFLARIGKDYSLRSISSESPVFEIKDATLLNVNHNNQFFMLRNDNTIKYFTLNKVIHEYRYDQKVAKFELPLYSELANDNLTVSFKFRELETGNIFLHVFKIGSLITDVTENGTEIFFKPNTGRDETDAISVSSGTNMVHANPSNGLTYLKFSPYAFGLYKFNLPIEKVLTFNSETEEYEVVKPNIVLDEEEYLVLDAYNEYILLVNIYGYVEFDIELFKEGKQYVSNEDIYGPSLRKVNVAESGYYKLPTDMLMNAFVRNYDGYTQLDLEIYKYDESQIIQLNANKDYLFNFEPTKSWVNLYINLFNLDTMKAYTGKETITSTTPVIRKLNIDHNGYYYFDTPASIEVKTWNYYDNFVTVDPSYNYNDHNIYSFSYENTYVLILSAKESNYNFEVKEMNYESLEAINFNKILNNNVVRKFEPTTTGEYLLEGQTSETTIYEFINGGLSTVNASRKVNDIKLYNLNEFSKYVVIANDLYNARFNFRPMTYEDIQIFSTDEYFDTYNTCYRRFSVTETGYYNISASNSSVNLTVYEVKGEEYSLVDKKDIEGKHVYLLNRNTKYLIKSDSYNYYSINLTKCTETNFACDTITADSSKYYYSRSSSEITKFTPTKSGIYHIYSSESYYMKFVDVYRMIDGIAYRVSPNTSIGDEYYDLDKNVDYYIESYSNTYSYYLYVNSTTYTESATSEYEIFQDKFNPFNETTNANGGVRYESTNLEDDSTSSFIIKANKNGNITFNYQIMTKTLNGSVDFVIISANGTLQSPTTSVGNAYKTFNKNLNKGEILLIKFTRDKNLYQPEDKLILENILFRAR